MKQPLDYIDNKSSAIAVAISDNSMRDGIFDALTAIGYKDVGLYSSIDDFLLDLSWQRYSLVLTEECKGGRYDIYRFFKKLVHQQVKTRVCFVSDPTHGPQIARCFELGSLCHFSSTEEWKPQLELFSKSVISTQRIFLTKLA